LVLVVQRVVSREGGREGGREDEVQAGEVEDLEGGVAVFVQGCFEAPESEG